MRRPFFEPIQRAAHPLGMTIGRIETDQVLAGHAQARPILIFNDGKRITHGEQHGEHLIILPASFRAPHGRRQGQSFAARKRHEEIDDDAGREFDALRRFERRHLAQGIDGKIVARRRKALDLHFPAIKGKLP